jgi:CheY-like chemotaxis protein
MSIIEGKKILIVDDKLGPRESIHMILKGQGAITLKVENGEQALDILKNNEFDLITTCLHMPGMQVIDLCKEIRKWGITTPLVVISGRLDMPIVEELK